MKKILLVVLTLTMGLLAVAAFALPQPDTSPAGRLIDNNLYSCRVECNGSPYDYSDCVQFTNPGSVGSFDAQFSNIDDSGSSSTPLGCSCDVDDSHRFLCTASTGNTSGSAGFVFSGMVGRSLNFDGNLADSSGLNCRYECMLSTVCAVASPE